MVDDPSDNNESTPDGADAAPEGAGTAEIAQLRHELDELKAQNEALRHEVEAPVAVHHRGRWFGCIALVVLGSLLVPASVLSVWLDRTIKNPDRWVETVAPLARDKAIQDAVAARVEKALFAAVDVEAEVRNVLPDRAQLLAAPISSGIQTLVSDVIDRLVRSDRFARLWDEANRLAAQQVSDVLTQANGKRGVVTIDLTNVAKEASSKLSSLGVPFVKNLGDSPVTFDVFQGEEIAQIQQAFRLFDRLAGILPWLTLFVFAAAVLVAPDRRKGLLFSSVGWVITSFGLLLLIALGRQVYLGSLPVGASLSANTAFFDIISRFLRGAGRTTVAVGLIVLLFTLLFGPSRPAVALRGLATRAFSAAGDEAGEHGVDLGPAGAWVARNVMALRVVVGIVAVGWLLLLDRPSAGNVVWIGVFALVALVLLELVARVGSTGGATAADGATPAAAGSAPASGGAGPD